MTEVRAFVGMASYYRRYIQGFADVTAPLHEVTKGGAGRFTWTVEAEHAFQTLKRLLCTSPILDMLTSIGRSDIDRASKTLTLVLSHAVLPSLNPLRFKKYQMTR